MAGPGNGVFYVKLKAAPARDFTEDEVTDAVKRIIEALRLAAYRL
jgi:hypothetical protein